MTFESTTKDELVILYQSFVESIASKVVKSLKIRVAHEDLVSYGYEGLLQAWDRYDHTRGKAAFTSFAYYRIRGAMFDGCRKEGWVPRERNRAAKTQAAINEQLEQAAGEAAQKPEARTVEEGVDRVSGLIGKALTVVLVEESDLEGVLIQYEPSQTKRVERKRINAQLSAAINQLDEVERQLIKRHHYFDEPLASVGRDLGMSTSWCSRMHSRALDKLREILGSRDELG